MILAIASGKGGTGKTTVAVNLAVYLSEHNNNVEYVDCDVEEPNGHLFLNPDITKRSPAEVPVPVIDNSKCIACGACVQFCAYRAIIRLGKMIMVFNELCHGCGGCMLVCPQKAITESTKNIGTVETGSSGKLHFIHGRLNVGEAMSPPLIRSVLKNIDSDNITIIDSPPGTSCPVIASIRNADFIVLVTEPTPFGLNDLGLALDMVQELDIPHGVVVNRSEIGNTDAIEFCKKRNVPILAQIPDEREIAREYSKGHILVNTLPHTRIYFSNIMDAIKKQVTK